MPLDDDRPLRSADDAENRPGAINYRLWRDRVLTWDLPVFCLLATVPAMVEQFFPNEKMAMAVAALLPIVAFFLRIRAGRRQLAANHGPRWMRVVQRMIFYFAITMMVFVDSLMLSMCGVAPDAELVFGILGLMFYILPMTIAMYPGRTLNE